MTAGHHRRLRAAGLLLGLTLAACAPRAGGLPGQPGAPDPAAGMPGTCGAAALQGLVGQPAGVLATMRFDRSLRIIRPGTAVTMDYSAARLNITIDEAERISRVACG